MERLSMGIMDLLMEENMKLPDEIYIVVTEHDGNQEYADLKKIPLVLETYLDERCSKLKRLSKPSA